MITQKELKNLLNYNPESGIFSWVKKPSSKTLLSDRVGWVDEQGYVYIRLKRKLYQAHRLAFLYMTGNFPKNIVDHKNRVVLDNRWSNLRDVTKRINQENRIRAGQNNKAGLLGVSPNGKRWAATIKHFGKHIYIGTFDTPQLAHAAYMEKKKILHSVIL